jgi:glycosyltransferase involved in cell wall biosynthesis
MNKPLVSILLPVFKSEKYLEKCLDSLITQTYKNIEIVAVVDYLGDDSLKILRRYRKIDKRIRVYSNLQRYGLASTLNKLVRLSKGQYVAFMDSQGIALKTRISRQISFLTENPKVAVVGSQISLLDEADKKVNKAEFPLNHNEIYGHLISGNSMKFEAAMIDRTRIPKDILKFRRDKHYPFVYADVFVKIGQYAELANLDDYLVQIRQKAEKKHVSLGKRLSFIKLLLESTTSYEYKPSIKSLFSPILKQS